MITSVTINPAGVAAFKREEIGPWLQAILETASTHARREVNVDTGNLRSTISTAIEIENGDPVGYLYAGTNYAIFQEFEPGERIPGQGTRSRAGGKPFLRPAAMAALQQFTR